MPTQQTTFVAGAGPSGLIAAYKLMKAGQRVVIADEQDEKKDANGNTVRFGKVETGTNGENFGAEFIDSKHKELIAIAQELGVPLIKAKDMDKGAFQKPDGSMISDKELLTAFRPVSEKIERDKKELARNPGGELAKKIDHMSMTEYLDSLNKEVEAEHPLSFFQKITHFFTRKPNPSVVPSDILQTVAGNYIGESGNTKPSALQFVKESSIDMSPEGGSLLNSDAGYRVEGGTAALFDAIKKKMEASGQVEFRYKTKLTSVRKKGDKFEAGFAEGSDEFDHVVMAMPMRALAKVDGLDQFGFSAADHDILEKGQYTYSSKVFINFNPEFAQKNPKIAEMIANECYISSDGVQSWATPGNSMEFLVGGEDANSRKGQKLADQLMQRYVDGLNQRLNLNLSVSDVFDTNSKPVVRGPDTARPCYASPLPDQVAQFEALSASIDRMAQQGIGVVGTFIPSRGEEPGSIGFMECGAESAERTVNMITGASQARAQAQEVAMQPGFTERYEASRAPNNQPGRGWQV